MNKQKFRRGLTAEATSYDHIRGKLDTEPMLEDLGIDIGFQLREHQWMCHCPNLTGNHLNGDANPSFGFNDEKLAFNCFTCGGGNVLELVQMMRPDLDDEAALRYLESFSDLTPGTQDDLIMKLQHILNPPKEEPEKLPDYPVSSLFRYKKIHPYLYDRGLSKDIIVEMQVGFDEDHCGIVMPHWFQDRLRGWQTRHLVENPKGVYHCEVDSCNFKNDKPISVPKYKNTPNFPKLNTLYGYDRLKRITQEQMEIIRPTSVIVVESPMTALKLMSMGFTNVVATFGAFSPAQGMLLLPYERIIFWPDNDAAGIENTKRAIDTIARYTPLYIVPAVNKPKGDAADLDEEGVEEHLSAAYNSSSFSLYKGLPTLEVINAIKTTIAS